VLEEYGRWDETPWETVWNCRDILKAFAQALDKHRRCYAHVSTSPRVLKRNENEVYGRPA